MDSHSTKVYSNHTSIILELCNMTDYVERGYNVEIGNRLQRIAGGRKPRKDRKWVILASRKRTISWDMELDFWAIRRSCDPLYAPRVGSCQWSGNRVTHKAVAKMRTLASVKIAVVGVASCLSRLRAWCEVVIAIRRILTRQGLVQESLKLPDYWWAILMPQELA